MELGPMGGRILTTKKWGPSGWQLSDGENRLTVPNDSRDGAIAKWCQKYGGRVVFGSSRHDTIEVGTT